MLSQPKSTKKLSLARNSGLVKCIKVLPISDRRKLFFIVVLQSAFNILDLFAVAAIGVIGALTIRGVSAQTPGDRVSSVLRFLGLENRDLQQQVFVLAIVAMFLFVTRTAISVFQPKKPCTS
jgi:hypothetical protein